MAALRTLIPSQKQPPLKSRLTLQIILLTALKIALTTTYRSVYPYLDVFAAGLGTTRAGISFLFSWRSILAATGPFLASLADVRGRKLVLFGGSAVFVFGSLLIGFFPYQWAFIAGILLAALGKAIFDPTLHAYIGDEVSYQQRGRAIAVTETGWSLSFIIGAPLAGFIIARLGWQAPFPIMAGIAVLLLIPLWRLLPRHTANPSHSQPVWANFRSIIASPAAIAGVGTGFFITAANELVNFNFSPWLKDSFGLQVTALGLTSLMIGISELAGEGVVGVLTDRQGKVRAIRAGILANCLAALLLPVLGGSLVGSLVGLFLFYLTFEFTLVSSLPLMAELLPNARATLLAANVAVISLGRAAGVLLAPWLYTLGILVVCLGVLVFNGLAWLSFNRVQKTAESFEVKSTP